MSCAERTEHQEVSQPSPELDKMVTTDTLEVVYDSVDTLHISGTQLIAMERDCDSKKDSCYPGLLIITSDTSHVKDTLEHVLLESPYGKTLQFLDMNVKDENIYFNYLQGSADRCETSFAFKPSEGDFLLQSIRFMCANPEIGIVDHDLHDLKISLYTLNFQSLCDSLYPGM